MGGDELAKLCRGALAAGPRSFGEAFVDEQRRWAIVGDGPAAIDLNGQWDELPPLVSIPVKLGALAAAQLSDIGTLLTSTSSTLTGATALGRSVVEACSSVAWLLDDTVTSHVRHRRAWLLWAVAEGNASATATADAGRTGAMEGSPKRLAWIENAIENRLGLRLERSEKAKPKDWRLDGIAIPGPSALVASAVNRWFPGADGRTLYSQVSRKAHSDVLVALALVDDALTIPNGEGLGFVHTTLAFWGLTWNHILAFLGVATTDFDEWLPQMLNAIGRGDLIDV